MYERDLDFWLTAIIIIIIIMYYIQAMAHTKAVGTEEVLKRIERELRLKLEESEIEIHSLTQKASSQIDTPRSMMK